MNGGGNPQLNREYLLKTYVNNEKLYVFLLTLGMRQEHTILLHLTNIILEELASAIR